MEDWTWIVHSHHLACLYAQKAYRASNVPILKRAHKLNQKKNRKIEHILKKIAVRTHSDLDNEDSIETSDDEDMIPFKDPRLMISEKIWELSEEKTRSIQYVHRYILPFESY